MSRDPERTVLADDQAEEARVLAAAAPIRGARLGVDAGRDEPLDEAARVDDPQRRVARPDERPDLVDDDLQDVVDRLEPGDRSGGRVERVDDTGRV